MIWKLGSLCETKEKIMEMGWQVAAGGLWHWKGFKLHSQQLCQVHCHRVCLPACHSECCQVSFQTSYLHVSQANHVNSRAACAFSTEFVPNTDAQMHMFYCHYISVMMWEPKGWSGLQVALMSWLQPQHHERKKKTSWRTWGNAKTESSFSGILTQGLCHCPRRHGFCGILV